MAVYKIFPSKDSTIYNNNPNLNTGLDAILELNKKKGISRILIQFDQNEINNLSNNLIGNNNFESYLNLKVSYIESITDKVTLQVSPLAQEWSMGVGKFNDPQNSIEGVTWRNKKTNILWDLSSIMYTTSSYDPNNPGGGVWFTGSNLGLNINPEMSFEYYIDPDFKLNVSNIIHNWISGSIDNNGFIIKYKEEFNSLLPQIEYFSRDTNTIYPPYLEFKWDDFQFNTGSSELSILDNTESLISISNIKSEYKNTEITKFRIHSTPKYPKRIYTTGSYYDKNHYLPPENSWYAIQDVRTNEYIVEFDNEFTRVSSDDISSYFNIHMNGFEPNRYYKILLKIHIKDKTSIVDNNMIFKVIN